MSNFKVSAAVALALLAAVALIGSSFLVNQNDDAVEMINIKFATHTQSLVPIKPAPLPVPWSAPDNLFLYWGTEVDKRVTGEAVRHLIKLGDLIGGEYRSSNFIKNFENQEFRDLTLTCCSVLLLPPLESGFPIYEPNGKMQHRISRYVANGNTMIVTGGITGLLFINQIFGYHLEQVPGNYDVGPFMKYQPTRLPTQLKKLGDVLRQQSTEITSVHKFTLPVGSHIYFASPLGSPFFSLKYCEVMNPKVGEPPIRVSPTSCPRWQAKGKTCGCGNVIFVGYDWGEEDNEKWNDALRATLTISIGHDEN